MKCQSNASHTLVDQRTVAKTIGVHAWLGADQVRMYTYTNIYTHTPMHAHVTFLGDLTIKVFCFVGVSLCCVIQHSSLAFFGQC